MEKRYQIVYTGKLLTDEPSAEVAKRMSAAFGLPVEKAQTLISSKKPRVIKKDLPLLIAEKYRDKLTETGLDVKIIEMSNTTAKQPPPLPQPAPRVRMMMTSERSEAEKVAPIEKTSTKEKTANPYAPPASDVRTAQKDEILLVSGWRRLFTWIIDKVAHIILAMFIGVILGFLLGYRGRILFSSHLFRYFFGFCIVAIYYIALEWSTGRTLGKLVLGTKVVNEQGGKPTAGQVVGRTFTRFVPFECFTFFGSQSRGWHDRWASTYVVRSR